MLDTRSHNEITPPLYTSDAAGNVRQQLPDQPARTGFRRCKRLALCAQLTQDLKRQILVFIIPDRHLFRVRDCAARSIPQRPASASSASTSASTGFVFGCFGVNDRAAVLIRQNGRLQRADSARDGHDLLLIHADERVEHAAYSRTAPVTAIASIVWLAT